MSINRLKQKWLSGEPAVNAWLSMGNAFSAEVVAAQGFDSITIDCQHGTMDYNNMLSMLQSTTAYDVTALVRVPWLDPGAIMRALDAGAYGIICPMINNRQQAEELVSYMRYPPGGTRSFGPTRIATAEGSSYYAEANDQVLCIAMVETAEAMSNLHEIATTPGLDAIYIGPADLSLGLSNGDLPPGSDRQEPEMIKAIKEIQSACKSAGIASCLHCSTPEYAVKAFGWGFNLCTLNSDARYLALAASDSIRRTRELLGS